MLDGTNRNTKYKYKIKYKRWMDVVCFQSQSQSLKSTKRVRVKEARASPRPHNLAIQTLGPGSHGAHGDQAALVAHVERGRAVAEDVAGRSARPVVLARELPVHALHPCRHGTHVDEGGGVDGGRDTLRERAGCVASECARDAGVGERGGRWGGYCCCCCC